MMDANLMSPEELRELADKKEQEQNQENKYYKVKENFYFLYSSQFESAAMKVYETLGVDEQAFLLQDIFKAGELFKQFLREEAYHCPEGTEIVYDPDEGEGWFYEEVGNFNSKQIEFYVEEIK